MESTTGRAENKFDNTTETDPPHHHPYKALLDSFEPISDQLSPTADWLPKPLQETSLHEITQRDDLDKLIEELKHNKQELGVDVEWSDHGYKAVTCLVQISTKETDFIIDALSLKDHMSSLNELLTDVNIVKVFHSAFNDLKQLQLDFNLYVVNMFDTQKAMKALGREKTGLAAALEDYYGVKKNKSLQRADFRKRPLPPEFKDYARTDSHFLINMYHKLKNELIQADLLRYVLDECLNDCRVIHEKVPDSSYLSVCADIMQIHNSQLATLKKLNSWRHRIAESVDKNTGVILSKTNMKALVLAMPIDGATIIQIAKSEYVKKHLDEIVKIMASAQISSSFRGCGSLRQQAGTKRKWGQTDFGNEADGSSTSYHSRGRGSRGRRNATSRRFNSYRRNYY